MNPVSARLLSQQLISPQFSSPHDVVSWMGAVQAQDYRMMRWAVEMRTKRPSFKAFEKEYNSGLIVRTHLFRTTWQLVAGEDWRWMLELCRDNALRGLSGWMKSNGVSIPQEEQERVHEIFADYLSAGRIARKADFDAALKDKGILMEDHRLSYHIRLAEYSGLLCSGDLLPQKHSYALAENKLPKATSLSRDESLGLLARKYYQSHGPATLEDFVWWSGLNKSDCNRGLDIIRNELTVQRWKGLTLYQHRDCRIRGMRSGTMTLLPPYDEYLIGYKSRQVVLHPDHAHDAHNNSGIFKPVVSLDGEIVGNWLPSSKDGGLIVFRPEAGIPVELFSRRWLEYQQAQAR